MSRTPIDILEINEENGGIRIVTTHVWLHRLSSAEITLAHISCGFEVIIDLVGRENLQHISADTLVFSMLAFDVSVPVKTNALI